MPFKTLVKDLVSEAIVIIDDLTDKTATYISVTGTTPYDPITDTQTEVSSSQVLPIVFSRFKMEEVDESVIVQTDMKALISVKDLTATPEISDRITDSAGVIWNVQKKMGVPGDSLWILHIRKA